MKARTFYKALSLLLTAAMVLSMGMTPVFAEKVPPPVISGECTHHTEHTDCGYTKGATCSHKHTEDCSTKELTCDLVEGDTSKTATDGEVTSDSGTAHTHGEDCYTKTDNCKHEHDETCGYTSDTACTFDKASCIQCSTDKKTIETTCTCEPVDSGNLPQGEPVHGADCPLFAPQATISAAVKTLIAMVDALPNAADITEENREATIPAFEAAAEAYEALSTEDKAAFEATEHYAKLAGLLGTLYNSSEINWNSNRLDPADFPHMGELPSKGEVSALLEQFYQRGSISPMMNEEPLETIEVDNSRIIHRPAGSMPTPELVRGNAPATYGLIDSGQSGPFTESDERYFRIEVSKEGSPRPYRAVKGKLLAAGDNTNVWVADDTDFHAKTETKHNPSTCNLKSVTYAMAKDLATGFDGIYSRMTQDFGSHTLYQTGYSNITQFGDLGEDEHVNILLYDIDALDTGSRYTAGYFWNFDMFNANQKYGDSEVIHPIDMFHVDIGTGQGWAAISGNDIQKLQLHGTLAHEFQHMLFFTHFGAYLNGDKSLYTWFDESLSGLANMYYVQPGAEIIDLGRTAYAASNLYDGNGYGDLFIFNNSMKNYGMGYLFSALFHNLTGGAYAYGVYDFFDSLGNDTTKEGFNAKFMAVNNADSFPNPLYHMGAMLANSLGLNKEEPLVALLTAYQYFMDSFAADGGLMHLDKAMPTQKMLRSTNDEQNLWALRPRLGKDNLKSVPEIPTLGSGSKIIIDDTIGTYEAVTRDMMYKLEGSGNVITIDINGGSLSEEALVYPYLALPNPDSATGANVYPLVLGPNRIVTNGGAAYLFVDTFLSAIHESDNVTVTYTWDEIGVGDLDGTATIDNTAPRIGDKLTGSYTGTAIAAENILYGWYAGESTGAVGTEKTYTVTPDDLGAQIILYIQSNILGVDGSLQAVTAAVKKKSYVGSAAVVPTVATSTHNSVTLNTAANSEYSNGGATWQDSPVFNGLSPDVTYNFYCRVKETDEMDASAKSVGTPVKTNALTVPTPTITTQPMSAACKYGDTIQPLTITATDSGGAKLSYLWYENATDSTVGGKLVANTAAASYTPTVKNAGTVYYYCVVSKTVEGQTATITSNTAAVKIDPLPISGTFSVTDVSKPYDGNTSIVGTAPTITLAGAINGEIPTATATFAYDTATVGTGKTVNATNITLVAENSINANYTLSATTASGIGAEISSINPTYSVTDQKILINKTLSDIQVENTATGANGEQVLGTLEWSEMQNGNVLDSYTFTGAAGSTKTLYWTFTPTSGNYKALSGSTVFTLTKKEVPALIVSNIEKTYDGKAVTTVTGTAKVGETSVAGTFAFDNAPTMTNANTYNVTVKFTPTNSARYEVAAISITVTIRKAAITITANDKIAYVGDAAPALGAADYTANGLASGEALKVPPIIAYESTPDMSKAGTMAITVSGAEAPDGGNYEAVRHVNGTLTISTKNTGGGSTGGGGGSTGGGGSIGDGGGSIVTSPVTPEKPNQPTTAETGVNSKTDDKGNATAAVAEKDITNAIEKAQKEAKKNGTEANGIAIMLNVGTDKKATSLNVTLPQKSVSALIAEKATSVTVKNDLTTVTLDLVTLKALAGGDVVLTVSKADTTKLSKEAQTAIGNRPVFQFGLTSSGKTVSDFKGGRAALQIPYTLTTTEQAGNLCGVYVDGNGKLTWLEASSYDPITGMMLISAQHFSTYGVGYKQSTPKFTDVGTHWAKNDIDFVVARGLLSGTSTTTFAPNTSMTRGMFVTALGRLAGVDTKKFENTKFTDVKADAYYAPYVAWANANNIVNGTTDTTFAPDQAITRQEMAVILVNYSKAIAYKLPSVHAEVSFTDSPSIASWAKDAVKQTQMAGILMGKSGNRFDPIATATRAEVSAMLRRYVELVVNT